MIKMYLLTSMTIMIASALAIFILIQLSPKTELQAEKQFKAARIALSFYMLTGLPATIIGIPYIMINLFM